MSTCRCSTIRLIACFCLFLAGPGLARAFAHQPAAAEFQPIFRVGAIDQSADDLNVLSVVPAEFVAALATLPDPLGANTWPQIQTGTYDVWADAQPYVYRLPLPTPRHSGTYRLRLGVLASHPQFPPRLVVRLAGRTVGEHQTRPGRQMMASRNTIQDIEPEVAEFLLPGSLFTGEETMLEVVLGIPSSWVFYDGIEWDWADQPFHPSVGKASLGTGWLVHRTERGPMQRPAIAFSLNGVAGPIEATVQLDGGESVAQQTLGVDGGVLFGSYELRPDIPAAQQERTLALTLRGEAIDVKRDFVLPGYRPIELYVVPQAHFDNGYTHPQEETVAINMESLKRAIDFGERYDNFSWTNESAYILQRWWETASPRDRERLLVLAREGKIGLDAGWLNMLTGLCTTEELHRWLLWAGTFAAKHDLDVRTVSLTDAPSHVWSLPTILANSGIEFLTIGANPDRSDFWRFGAERSHNPFWWEGPDGGRVLTLAHRHYAHATTTGLTASLEDAEREVPRWLDRYFGPEAPGGGYDYNVLHLHGAYWDNRLLDERLPAVVKAWNEKYAWPVIKLATNSEFFERLREEAQQRAEVYRGDQGAYWEDGAASSARETALNRRAARELSLAEMLLTGLHARGALAEAPAEHIRKGWESALLYDEHTWGAAWSISSPEDPRTFDQFSTKASYAHEAARLADLLLDLAGTGIAGAHQARRELGGEGELQIDSAGDSISSQDIHVAVDPQTGLITSIRRRLGQTEIVEQEAGDRAEDGFGQILYYAKPRSEHPNNVDDRQFDMTLTTPRFLELRAEDDRLVSVFAHDVLGRIEMHLAPAADAPRLDIEYHLTGKTAVTDLEAIYIAFPFAFRQPTIEYEVGGAVVRAGRDWLPHACLDWFSVQDFVLLRDRGGERTVIWSSPDAPLVCLQGVNTHKGLRELPIENGRVYSYLMNNFWQTNYQAAQGGDFVFRYSIAVPESATNARAPRLVSQIEPAVLAALDELIRVEAPNVRLVNFKPAEHGEGYIVRLQEMDGGHGPVRLKIGALAERGIAAAEIVTGMEHDHAQVHGHHGGEVVVDGATLTTHIHPYEIQTLRIRPR